MTGLHPRRKAFLEAATLCSQYGDGLSHPVAKETAYECSRLLAKESEHESTVYPPSGRTIPELAKNL